MHVTSSSRRFFLGTSAVAATGLLLPDRTRAASANEKLNLAIIGAGGRQPLSPAWHTYLRYPSTARRSFAAAWLNGDGGHTLMNRSRQVSTDECNDLDFLPAVGVPAR